MRISIWLYGMEQCLCAGSLLIAIGVCTGARRPVLWRLLTASLLSGALAAFAVMDGRLTLRLASLTLMMFLPRLAWPRLPRAVQGRAALATLALPLMMTGLARMMHSLGLTGPGLSVCLCLLTPLLAHFAPQGGSAACVTVEITHKGSRVSLTALVDSGNLLRDPLTRLPVIVVSRRTVSHLTCLPPPGEIAPGMRLISVRTAAGSALMPLFRPGRVRLLLPGGWTEVAAMIGISPGGYDGFQALLPAELTRMPHILH